MIGRPAVFDQAPYTRGGEKVTIRSLRAAYRVTADNPGEAFLGWVQQMDRLAIAEMTVRAGSTAEEPWLEATSENPFTEKGPPPDLATLRLWETEGDPILFVEIDRAGADDPGRVRITGDRGRLIAPPPAGGDSEREAGDALFGEGDDEVGLPDGSRTDLPTLPLAGGRGSFSVFFADDAAAAVKQMLDEAEALAEDATVTEPEESTVEEVDVVTAGFSSPGEGWGFDIVAVRGEDDDEATVYVTSYAG